MDKFFVIFFNKFFYLIISFFVTYILVPSDANASNGVASTNSYAEEIHGATDFRARTQHSSGQRSSDGVDFVVTLERENISNAGTLTLDYNDDGATNVSLNTSTYPVNSYLIYLNDDHNSKSDRTNKIGQIVFDNEIYGIYDDVSDTIYKANISKSGATYPTSSNSGYSARAMESFNFYANTTTTSTTGGDWVSIGSDKKTLRIGAKNGDHGDYIRVITAAETIPVVDFNTTSSNGAESVSSKAITVDLSGTSSQAVTVNYAITGTATASGTDFTLANGTLTIAAGQTSGTITIASIVNDSLDEANETVILTLSSPGNATLGSDDVHTYTITDNDNPPVVDFNTTSSNGAESVSSKAIT
ncbi:MAG: hypothetical protein ACI9JG_000247, partial [Alphaproteobacteria bacterium]